MATILAISGSLREGSTNSALVRTAVAVAPPGIAVVRYDGLARLPHFNPDDDTDPLHAAVADLRAQLRGADALLVSTPEYAGALPGSFKNLLDWTVGGGTYGMPVAWVNTSASGSGARDAHDSLRKVLERTGTVIVEAACQHIPVARDAVDAGGLIPDPALVRRVTDVLAAMAAYLSDHPPDPAVPR